MDAWVQVITCRWSNKHGAHSGWKKYLWCVCAQGLIWSYGCNCILVKKKTNLPKKVIYIMWDIYNVGYIWCGIYIYNVGYIYIMWDKYTWPIYISKKFPTCSKLNMPGQEKPGIMLKNLALSLGDGVSCHASHVSFQPKQFWVAIGVQRVGEGIWSPNPTWQLSYPRLPRPVWSGLHTLHLKKQKPMGPTGFQRPSKKLGI